ncbi:MAG: ferrous iron transport protein B [Candidatus Gastranaerophilales bacterium]|nr:ferrous iron transport protein B [Candidatus Gastranaerophilales bacterium]
MIVEKFTKKTLDKLKIGEEAYITEVKCKDKALRNHILNMGLTPGVEVTLMKTAPLGDPLEIRLRGYELTLRKCDASKIFVDEIHAEHTDTKKKKDFQVTEHSQKGETRTYIDKNKKNKVPPKKFIKLALAGNQNTGKTTLFNKLTGMNRHVGNFPGVTVDRTDADVKNYQNVMITDLPGIYSLSPYSKEEIVTRNFLLNEKPDGIINIIDATNIERNLFLTLQLIELNIPMVIALNMMDEVSESGGSIDINTLETTLGVPVIPISASKNEGLEELTEHIVNVARYNEKPERADFCGNGDEKAGSVHRCIHSIVHLIEDHAKAANIPVRFAASKVAERDTLISDMLSLDKGELKTIEQIISSMEEERKMDANAALADMRFSFIEKLCENTVSKPDETLAYKLSVRADKILTGKYTAVIAFLAIMTFIFYMTFGPLGSTLSSWMENGIKYVVSTIDSGLTAYGLNPVVHSLLIDGVAAGIGSVLSFLPIIVILFFFLSLMEDSGYMARIAFVMDKALRKIGLSGRSFVPMLIGFGCSVPAIMAARTLPSERDRKMTIFLTPFMSCSAKLPVYALFTAAFFDKYQVQVILCLYLIGIITGIISIFVMKFFVFKGEAVPFVMELPNYRMPGLANVSRLIYSKAKDFVNKAFTVIFVATLVIWFLQNFDSRLNLVTDSSQSLLAMLGSTISPIFEPLGISDWRVATAFITGFMAKESVVSTLTVLSGGDTSEIPKMFSTLTAFVFLVFTLLYTPCVAAIATVKKELGNLYAVIVVLLQCSIAWIVAFMTYNIGLLIIS